MSFFGKMSRDIAGESEEKDQKFWHRKGGDAKRFLKHQGKKAKVGLKNIGNRIKGKPLEEAPEKEAPAPKKGPVSNWKEADYSRRFWRDSVGDKLKLVGNIIVRETPGFMFKTRKTNDIMVMEKAQEIMNQIAEEKHLKGIFDPGKTVAECLGRGVLKQAENGKGDPQLAGEITDAVEQSSKGTAPDPKEIAGMADRVKEQAASSDTTQVKNSAEDKKGPEDTRLTRMSTKAMSPELKDEAVKAAKIYQEKEARKMKRTNIRDLPEEDQQKIMEGLEKIRELAAEYDEHDKDDAHQIKKGRYKGFSKEDRRNASARRHKQRADGKTTGDDIAKYAGWGTTGVGLGKYGFTLAEKLTDFIMTKDLAENGPLIQFLLSDNFSPLKLFKDKKMMEDLSNSLVAQNLERLKIKGITDKIGMGGAVFGSVLSVGTDAIDLGRKIAKDKKDWHNKGKSEKIETSMDYIENAANILGDGGKFLSSVPIAGMGAISGSVTALKGIGQAVSGLTRTITRGRLRSKVTAQANKTKEEHKKTFHKKEGESGLAANLRLQREAGQKALRKYMDSLGSGDGVPDDEKCNEVLQQAYQEESKKQLEHYRTRNAQRLAKLHNKEEQTKGIMKLTTGLLNMGGGAATAALSLVPPGDTIASVATTALGKLSDFIGGKVAGHFARKDLEKIIKAELKIKKIEAGPGGSSLDEFNTYDDLKKYFKFEYAQRAAKKGMPKALRRLSDADFKTLMSNALSGRSGGIAGIRDGIAESAASYAQESGNTDLIEATGASKDADQASLAQHFGVRESKDLGEYTGHQTEQPTEKPEDSLGA